MISTLSAAVVSRRSEPPNSLDDFPTPPWATRALVECVLFPPVPMDGLVVGLDVPAPSLGYVWEPACGRGIMSSVLTEYASGVYASDVHDYGHGYPQGSFIGGGFDQSKAPRRPDWIITNPPFNKAREFFDRAIVEARDGVALLLRTNWLEGIERYNEIFKPTPPSTVAVFVERVPMHRGRWDPDGDTLTSYTWFVWQRRFRRRRATRLMWIPPGQRVRLEKPDDRRRFAPTPGQQDLFSEAAA